jgi:translation initiation factor 2B subunit (eIF-2B alpha/beta/delta family)
VEATTQAEPAASPFEQARQALSALEREETDARYGLGLLEWQEEQLSAAARRGVEKAARREELARLKAEQWRVVREVRERLHAARRSYEQLQRHTVELQFAIRREERAVAQWQRQVKNTEEQLARWQRLLAEAQSRLEQAQRELGRLTGFAGGPPP